MEDKCQKKFSNSSSNEHLHKSILVPGICTASISRCNSYREFMNWEAQLLINNLILFCFTTWLLEVRRRPTWPIPKLWTVNISHSKDQTAEWPTTTATPLAFQYCIKVGHRMKCNRSVIISCGHCTSPHNLSRSYPGITRTGKKNMKSHQPASSNSRFDLHTNCLWSSPLCFQQYSV